MTLPEIILLLGVISVIGFVIYRFTLKQSRTSLQLYTSELDLSLEIFLAEHGVHSQSLQSLTQVDTPLYDKHRGFYGAKRTGFFKQDTQQYLYIILTSDKSTNYFEYFSELRARRALFNKPKEYLAAFGESPDRKQLARLMGGADESVASCARGSCTSDRLSI